MRHLVALVHEVTAALARCELQFLQRTPIDVERARAQHRDYCRLLERLGAIVHAVATSPAHPDAVFVEDCAVVLDEIAIATRMGVASRTAEVDNLVPVLARYRKVVRIDAPATLEGGDVLRLGDTLFVGRSARTNQQGIDALAAIATPLGHRVVPVDVSGCLHLKTAVTALDADTLLANPAWIDVAPFRGCTIVPVDADEPFAANTLRVDRRIVMSASHPRTMARVADLGHAVHAAAIDELEKAEAGLTCLSLLFEAASSAARAPLAPGARARRP